MCKDRYYILVHQENDLPNSSLPIYNTIPYQNDFQSHDTLPKYDIPPKIPDNSHICLHALIGNSNIETLRLKGTFYTQSYHICGWWKHTQLYSRTSC